MRFFVGYELKKDKEILENLADKQMPLKEMQLGRYDLVLGENRQRIDRLYRGKTPDKDAINNIAKSSKHNLQGSVNS